MEHADHADCQPRGSPTSPKETRTQEGNRAIGQEGEGTWGNLPFVDRQKMGATLGRDLGSGFQPRIQSQQGFEPLRLDSSDSLAVPCGLGMIRRQTLHLGAFTDVFDSLLAW